MKPPTPVQTIDYVRRAPLSSGRVWTAAVLAMTGLGLIALGGCFLVGVLILLDPPLAFGAPNAVPVWSWGTCAFAAALCLLAALCFVSAAWLLLLTVRNLLRSLSAAHVQSGGPSE